MEAARADVTEVFNLSGVFTDGSGLSGTVTIDVTTGLATAIDADVNGIDFTNITSQFGNVTYYTVNTNRVSGSTDFFLRILGADLVDYRGGPLSANTAYEKSPGDLIGLLGGGSATLPASPVPEPSTWGLMILGFAGVGFLAVRRAGKATAVAAI